MRRNVATLVLVAVLANLAVALLTTELVGPAAAEPPRFSNYAYDASLYCAPARDEASPQPADDGPCRLNTPRITLETPPPHGTLSPPEHLPD